MPDLAVPYAAPMPAIVLSDLIPSSVLSNSYSQKSSVEGIVVSTRNIEQCKSGGLTYSSTYPSLRERIRQPLLLFHRKDITNHAEERSKVGRQLAARSLRD